MTTDLCILATGGTMEKVHNPISEQRVFSAKSYVPDVRRECRVESIPHQILMLKDSWDTDDPDRETIQQAILKRPEHAIAVTHGTRTMMEAAAYLKDPMPGKTVVLTGAMRPFSLFQSDASFNLGCAIIAARLASPGIYIAMNGRTFNAGKVTQDMTKGIFVEKGSCH